MNKSKIFCEGIFKICVFQRLYKSTHISGCFAFSLNSQSVSFLQAYLLLGFISGALLAETGGKCPLVFSVTHVVSSNSVKLHAKILFKQKSAAAHTVVQTHSVLHRREFLHAMLRS